MQLTEETIQQDQCENIDTRSLQQHMPNVLIAGGGSGGHVAPAIAVAEELESRGCTVVLAHSNRAIDEMMIDRTSFDGIQVPAAPVSVHPMGALKFCLGFLRTNRMIRDEVRIRKINCVLATGGFVAAPALKAANDVGCPSILLNIDDPPGKANRLAVRWADQVLSTVVCDLDRATLINPPLRKVVIASSDSDACKERLGLDTRLLTLLVTGASQGARTINELVCELATRFPSNFQGWQVLHIAGTKNAEQLQDKWIGIDVPCKVLGFHHEMGDAWGAADLAITRGGANTVAEISMNSVPTVVMPYPFHKDEHQRSNTLSLADLGGVLIATDHIQLDQNLHDAGDSILELMGNHQSRVEMKQSMVDISPINGVTAIADACISCVEAPLV